MCEMYTGIISRLDFTVYTNEISLFLHYTHDCVYVSWYFSPLRLQAENQLVFVVQDGLQNLTFKLGSAGFNSSKTAERCSINSKAVTFLHSPSIVCNSREAFTLARLVNNKSFNNNNKSVKWRGGANSQCLSFPCLWSGYGGCSHLSTCSYWCVCICVCVWLLAQAANSKTSMATRHKKLNYSVSMSETYSWVSTDTLTHAHTFAQTFMYACL